MLSFAAVRALTGFLVDVEADADSLGWSRPPLLLLVQDLPAPSTTTVARRQIRALHLPLRPARVGRYRAGLPDFLADLAAALRTNPPLGRPTLAACVDLGRIADLLTDPLPGLRLVAWAICYEDVLVAPDDLHEIRRRRRRRRRRPRLPDYPDARRTAPGDRHRRTVGRHGRADADQARGTR
ncbi:hypothetical protein [Micromonospora fluostatini]|uniref:hypothetical protein n=1 Tax=Micromonospora sp. JCM 30529 TaxID=3421643 RepID=UPI003D171CE5